VEFWLNAWIHKDRNGDPFMAMRWDKPKPARNGVGDRERTPQEKRDEFGDDIPF
jgi:hypothetical protein